MKNRSVFFALVLLIGLAAPAQNLPKLTVNPSANRTMRVNWPYTNAGFVLQESGVLQAASNWQRSALSPVFNSNAAEFSISAAATNPVRFFRLSQPADLRGLYVYSSDVSQISSNYAQTLTASLGVPGIDGLVLVLGWSAVEPGNGQYNWTNLDEWMNRAIALGKKIDLAIPAGKDTPAWLFQPVASGGAGATPLNFTISPHQGATSNCIPETIAAPWDAAFLGSWNAMLTNLAFHLKRAGTYSNLTLLRLTGINRTTDELRLPAETPNGTGLDCVSNAPAIWQAAGYTPTLLLYGWSNIISAFQASFPDKPFSVAIIPNNAFPPIDNNSQILTNKIPDATQPLLGLAAQKFAGHLVVQFNFLMTGSNASAEVIQAAQTLGTLPAFQSNNYFGSSGGGAACGGTVNDPVPCTNDTYLAELREGIYPLKQANGLRAQYIEVFPANAIAFTNAVWQAHSEFFAPP